MWTKGRGGQDGRAIRVSRTHSALSLRPRNQTGILGSGQGYFTMSATVIFPWRGNSVLIVVVASLGMNSNHSRRPIFARSQLFPHPLVGPRKDGRCRYPERGEFAHPHARPSSSGRTAVFRFNAEIVFNLVIGLDTRLESLVRPGPGHLVRLPMGKAARTRSR